MKIPSNLIKKNQYTLGGKLIYLDTYQDYQGYYYIINNQFFEGKEFKVGSRELIQINSDKVNKLKFDKATSTFANLSNIKLPNNKLPSSIYQYSQLSFFTSTPPDETRFFAKKLNNSPILIKEIDEDTFKKIQSDPVYQTTYIGTYLENPKTSEQAYSQMVGLREFVEG